MAIDFSSVNWEEKLTSPSVGLGAEFLKKRHGPCPLCGGRDRYRYENKGGQGTYFCSNCGPGTGFTLIKKLTGWSGAEVMRYLDDGTAASIEKPLERAAFQDPDFTPENVARNRTKLRRAWKHSTPLNGTDAASRYLQMRVPGCDITKLAVGLRYNRSMQFWEEDDKGKFVQRGYFPVMLGLAIDKDGHAITCHRTYLTADGRKAPFENVKKQMKGVRKLDGAAVRVIDVPESRVLGLTEGIENAVAVGTAYRYSINVWSTLNCSNLEMVEIPEGRFDKIVIFADHDQLDPKTNRRPGLHYAELLKARLEAAGYTVELKVPPVEGTDFADLWNEVYQARQQARRDKLQRQARETAQRPGNIVHGPLLAPRTPSTTRVLHA